MRGGEILFVALRFTTNASRLFRRHMDRDDPAGQVLVRHLAVACLTQDLAEPFLIRERTDRCREVFVHARLIPRHFRADRHRDDDGVFPRG